MLDQFFGVTVGCISPTWAINDAGNHSLQVRS